MVCMLQILPEPALATCKLSSFFCTVWPAQWAEYVLNDCPRWSALLGADDAYVAARKHLDLVKFSWRRLLGLAVGVRNYSGQGVTSC